MDPRRLLLALKAHYMVAMAVFALTLVAVMAATELMPRRYSTETAVMVDIRSPDPISNVLLAQPNVPGSMSTQVEIIKSNLVARKVVRILKLDENPAVKEGWLDSTHGRVKLEDWLASSLQRGVSVTPSRDSNIILIGYGGTDPRAVAAVANAFAQAYIEASIELKVEPARQYGKFFSEQATALRDQVEKAQARLSRFQQEKGIVVTGESVDYELTRLGDLSSRLAVAQSETRDAQTKQRSGSAEALPEVAQDSVVQGLRSNINQLEVKLKEAQVNLGPRHPQYLRMVSELEELKRRLAQETGQFGRRYGATSAVGQSRETELRAAIEAQKRKILSMKKEFDEIAVLQRDVETAKRAYEAVTNRLNQTNIESQATRGNVSVLSPALEPVEPFFPKPREKMLLMAIVLGLMLAAGAVFGLEVLDPRVRTPEDLADMLQVPVLAVIARRSRARPLALPSRPPALPAG
jgi:succinoglycan biosynthesis transport protein ExoP